MPVTVERQDRVLLIAAVLAAALIHVSIAASQILLGVGIALLLVFRRRLEFPRIWIPLVVFFALTLVAVLLSPDPWGGHAQIRKFFVFLFIPLLYGVFSKQFDKLRYMVAAWAAVATASGVWGLIQFAIKYREAASTGEDFYTAYVAARITGFESHWMTFSELQLSALVVLLAHWCFAKQRLPAWCYVGIPILSAAILLAWTRSVWLATVPSTLYLLWYWRPKAMLAVPLIAVAAFAIAPGDTRDRLVSLVQPHGETDSNEHRIVTFRTGVEMVKAHPWFGLGPEQIGRQFNSYVPASIKRPLPPGYYGHLHNIYLQYAAERGVPAMLVLMWLIGELVWDCVTTLRRLPAGRSDVRFILHAAVALTIAVLVEGLFEYNLGDSEVLMMFVSVLALAYGGVRVSGAEDAAA